jgi:pimeloyl-ACP methyl ester carboxylesterase
MQREVSMSRTIVMIHGMFCGGWVWENYRVFFEARGYRCIVPTLRYHDVTPGEPPDPRLGTTSMLDYAADLEEEIRRLEEPPVIMGHSMGGLLAQILGGRGLASSLVLLNPASPAGIMAFRFSVLKIFGRLMKTWGFWKIPVKLNFEETVFALFNFMPVEEHRKTFDRFVFESGRAAWEIGFWAMDRKKATRVDEKKVACPVLIVTGAGDNITPASVVRAVAKKYRAAFKEFAGHGHWIEAEPGWEEIARYIHDWLKGK